MVRIGYMRKSTVSQSFQAQEDALRAAGCTEIYSDTASGARDNREGLQKALQYARPNDCLVVVRLDRLGRSLPHLVQVVADLSKRGIHFISLNENIDTGSAAGKLIFHIFSSLSSFERELIVERTRAGLEAARARGRKGGRPTKMTDAQIEKADRLMSRRDASVADIAKVFGVSRSTLYASLAEYRKKKKAKGDGR